ncbi:hypothetical protein ABKN59_001380 [Abortiporus biennis]
MSKVLLGNIPETSSPQLQVALSWLESFVRKDFNKVASLVSESYAQKIMPRSMGIENLVFSKAQSLGLIQILLGSVDTESHTLTGTVHERVEVGDTVILHVTTDGTSVTGNPYTGDFIFWFEVKKEEDGQYRVVALKEFLDSKFMSGI